MTPIKYNLPDGYRGDTYIFPEFQILNTDGVNLTSGLLESGEDYLIQEYKSGDNFANLGATENKTGVVFTASGTTPTTWTNVSVLQKVTSYQDLTDVVFRMQLYKDCGLVKTFTNSDFDVIDATTGKFTLNNWIATESGQVTYDIQLTLPSGIVKTYARGKWRILSDITQG